MTRVSVRDWDEADLATIGRLHAQSRQHAYAGLVDAEALARVTPESQEVVWRDRWLGLRGRPEPHVAVLAEVAGRAVGFAVAFALPEPDAGSWAELNAIHVLPTHHGAGIGPVLMDAVVAAMRTWDVPTAHLLVVEGNERAQAFYRRSGWLLSGPAGAHDVGGADVAVLRFELTLAGSD